MHPLNVTLASLALCLSSAIAPSQTGTQNPPQQVTCVSRVLPSCTMPQLGPTHHTLTVPGTQPPVKYYVAYSTVCNTSSTGEVTMANNVTMSILPLAKTSGGRDRVLIFGTGYGERVTTLNGGVQSGNCNSSLEDALLIDSIITNCAGLVRADTDLLFVAPHTHADHINPQVVQELMSFGYGLDAVQYHDDGVYEMVSPTNMGTLTAPWGDCMSCSDCRDTDLDGSVDSCVAGGPYKLQPLESDGRAECGMLPPPEVRVQGAPWSETMESGVELQLIRRGTHGCCSGCPINSTCWNPVMVNTVGAGCLDLVINSSAPAGSRVAILGSAAVANPNCPGYSNFCPRYQAYDRVIAAHGNVVADSFVCCP